ncbi:MAG: hypothetical protein WCS52_12375 [bacterium]|jgi:hypothetical protein
MNMEELERGIHKGLEVWSLQSVSDLAIMLSFVILALVAGRSYLDSIRRRLTLRLAAEAWETGTDVLIDLLLGFVTLVGVFIINPDIMADIKIGVPWVPLAMVLMAVALVLRVFHGGRIAGSPAWWSVLGLLVVACAANWFGFTFVMEAAGDEYLKGHADSFWPMLKSMRSDLNPDLAMVTFQWANPALMLVFVWALIVGAMRSSRHGQEKNTGHDS